MANPDDEHFDEFVLGVMDASFSTVVDEVEEISKMTSYYIM